MSVFVLFCDNVDTKLSKKTISKRKFPKIFFAYAYGMFRSSSYALSAFSYGKLSVYLVHYSYQKRMSCYVMTWQMFPVFKLCRQMFPL